MNSACERCETRGREEFQDMATRAHRQINLRLFTNNRRDTTDLINDFYCISLSGFVLIVIPRSTALVCGVFFLLSTVSDLMDETSTHSSSLSEEDEWGRDVRQTWLFSAFILLLKRSSPVEKLKIGVIKLL